MKYRIKSFHTALLPLLINFILVLSLYIKTFSHLITVDWQRDDYSYGLLIPFVVIYLFWKKKNIFFSLPSKPGWAGILILCIGIVLFWFGELAGEFFMLYFSSWVIILSIAYINFGKQKVKIIVFPLFFSLFSFPLPNLIHGKITLNLKIISSKIGVLILQRLGISAYREGNIIDLGFTQFQVIDACNGLRYLIPLIIFSILICYFWRASLWEKCLIVLSAIPIAILTNSFRIASVGILYPIWGPMVVDGFFHDFSGWVIFMLSLGVLVLEIRLMNFLFPAKQNGAFRSETIKDSPFPKPAGQINNSIKPFILPQFYVPAALLIITILLINNIEFREKIPISKPFNNFPMKVNKWNGTNRSMEKKFIDILDLSDYKIIDYQNDDERNVNFYVAYYESQRKGESIHSPASCLPGSGWIFTNAGKLQIFLGEENPQKSIPVRRALMEKSGYKQLVYYWFPQRGRILTNAYELKLYNFWDALTKQRTDGALVRVITRIYPDETVKEAESRLQSFVADIVPILEQFLPGEKI